MQCTRIAIRILARLIDRMIKQTTAESMDVARAPFLMAADGGLMGKCDDCAIWIWILGFK